tara:strand:+ start:1212 stop:2246 length:1035 start_codon:yes stop_codon:yes gene_type:complete
MSETKKFQLFGHGNGWPSSGFANSNFIEKLPRGGTGTLLDTPTTISSNSFNMGSAIPVIPYEEPSSSNSFAQIGYKRFRTLGGYSDSDTGKPTVEQLNLSLVNAMKLFYNVERGGSANASANLTATDGANVSSSISPSVLENYTGGTIGSDTFTGQALSPRERVISFIKELDLNGDRLHNVHSNILVGNRVTDDFFIPESSVDSSATCGRYLVTIVRLFDNTDTTNPIFLGYGLKSHLVAVGGIGFDNIVGAAESYIGSYFTPRPIRGSGESVEFDISDTTVGDIPLLTMNQVRLEDGGEFTSSVTSSSATFSIINRGIDGSINERYEGFSSISPSYDFYTYEE